MKLRKHYQVNELFTSLQGEGVLTGTPATFIRLQGCTVGCWWCDSGPLADETWGRRTNGTTRNTWGSGGTRMSVHEIMQQVNTHHVIITGGEPTMYDLDGLLVPLQGEGHYVQLETSGQNEIKGLIQPDWITWSPKENLKWDAPYGLKSAASEVKWVVDESLKLHHVRSTFMWYIKRANATYAAETTAQPATVPFMVLMPEGSPPRPEMVERVQDWLSRLQLWEQPFWRFGDRMQYRIGVR